MFRLILVSVLCLSAAAFAVQIHQESFESTTGWTVTPAFGNGVAADDYMGRYDNTTVPAGLATQRGSLDGTMFIAGEDTDGGGGTLPANGIYTVALDAVSVAGYSTLTVSVALNGNPVNNYDTAALGNGDYLRVYANIDGGGDVLIGQFTKVGASGSNGRLGQDTNLDGLGDVEIPDYANFNHYTFNVPGSGNNIVVKVVTRFESGNEEIVYDNIRINGDASDTAPPEITSVSALSTTQVDVNFNEDVEETTAETLLNYSVNNGIGNPLTATRDGSDLSLVHLTFNALAANMYTLTANGVEDLAGNPCVNETGDFTVNAADVPAGTVVITEIMYDDTASTDAEWVEIHNTIASAVDISGWALLDDNVYPSDGGGEGAIRVPFGTTLAANGYAILSKVALDQISDEIVCTEYTGSWTLANTGDNLALYTAATGGVLVDGVLSNTSSDYYPDLAGTNEGNSIEKCDPNSGWSSDPADWTESLVQFSTAGRYRHCTPYTAGFCCPEGIATGHVSLVVSGPPIWGYRLEHVVGCLDTLIFTNFCEGTTGSVDGDASNAGWTATTDGNDGDTIIFVASTPLNAGHLDGFQLNHETCSDFVNWTAGDSSGSVEGPLPVELLGFTAIAGDNSITLYWSTASEQDNERFDIVRDGELVYQINGAGTSVIEHHYQWTDNNVDNGTNYTYTLIGVNTSGAREELGAVSAVPGFNSAIITDYALHQNYPNPFNPETSIAFDLPEAGFVSLKIFNAMGQEITTLVSHQMNSGRHTAAFNAATLPSGNYFYRLEAGSFAFQRKMLLLK